MGDTHESTSLRARDPGASRQRGETLASHGFDVALNPATVGTLLAGADRATRERLVTSLQRLHGNAAIQRLLATGDVAVQRWAVTLAPGTSDCMVVAAWMDRHSPYRNDDGWAKTRAQFSWTGDPAFRTDGGVITATVSNPHVTKSLSVDMPSWAPTDPVMRTAWASMITDLRAHEARHEAIANTWDATLRTNLRELSLTVTSRNQAAWTAAVQREWDGWLAQHQADQRAIDPFTAELNCDTTGGSGSSGISGGTGGGGGGGTADLSGLDAEPDLGGF
ncbi:MAG TPA: DUF922 domain-containing protein [Candidatus Limnocylindrales bacterium]